jgi:hypothetical protein
MVLGTISLPGSTLSERISAQTDRIGRQTATIQAQSWDFIPAMRAEGRALATAMQATSSRIGITESTIQAQGRDLPLRSRLRVRSSAPASTPSRPGWTNILAVTLADSGCR